MRHYLQIKQFMLFYLFNTYQLHPKDKRDIFKTARAVLFRCHQAISISFRAISCLLCRQVRYIFHDKTNNLYVAFLSLSLSMSFFLSFSLCMFLWSFCFEDSRLLVILTNSTLTDIRPTSTNFVVRKFSFCKSY